MLQAKKIMIVCLMGSASLMGCDFPNYCANALGSMFTGAIWGGLLYKGVQTEFTRIGARGVGALAPYVSRNNMIATGALLGTLGYAIYEREKCIYEYYYQTFLTRAAVIGTVSTAIFLGCKKSFTLEAWGKTLLPAITGLFATLLARQAVKTYMSDRRIRKMVNNDARQEPFFSGTITPSTSRSL